MKTSFSKNMQIAIPHIPEISTDTGSILTTVFSIMRSSSEEDHAEWHFTEKEYHPLLLALLAIYKRTSNLNITTNKNIDIYISELGLQDTEQSNSVVNELIQRAEICPHFNRIKTGIKYFIDEIVCNMQQHSLANTGHIHLSYNIANNTLNICLADNGISILGSYVNTGKHLEDIGGDASVAITYAKRGYSTKNLPDAENRGFGLSTTSQIVVDGLKGSYYILSGNAFLCATPKNEERVFEFPEEIEWKGTLIMASIPMENPHNSFNLYSFLEG